MVRKTFARRPRTRSATAWNSGPRWCSIGWAIAAVTSGGTGVGPGVTRYGLSGIEADDSGARKLPAVEALLSFGAALVALRLAGDLAGRYRARRTPALAVWAAAILAYGLAAGALAWGAAAGWDGRTFRLYYLFGGLLTAPLLGAGSLLLAGRRRALHGGLVYTGLAIGVAVAAPLTAPVGGGSIPSAQDHLDFFPARLVAVLGNTAGTLAVVAVALVTFRHRPLANALIVAGVAVAAAGSALAGLGVAETAISIAAGAALLYGGVVFASDGLSPSLRPRRGPRTPPGSARTAGTGPAHRS